MECLLCLKLFAFHLPITLLRLDCGGWRMESEKMSGERKGADISCEALDGDNGSIFVTPGAPQVLSPA